MAYDPRLLWYKLHSLTSLLVHSLQTHRLHSHFPIPNGMADAFCFTRFRGYGFVILDLFTTKET